jgi:iron-sulfur cluster insertion protein
MITLTDSLKSRIEGERTKTGTPGLMLRVSVDSGGCSGFQYKFSWDANVTPDDAVYGDAVVIDDVSLPFMRDATIDFVKTLMGSDFKITNPNAASGCGCGNSFAV